MFQTAPPEIWSYGPWAAAGFLILLATVPALVAYFRSRAEARDKAEQEDRAAREKERRDKDEQLILFLRESAADARQELKAQGAEFLKALERRDKLQEEIVKNLNGLSVLIEAQTRRARQ